MIRVSFRKPLFRAYRVRVGEGGIMGFFSDLVNYGPAVAFESAKNDIRTDIACRKADRLLAESEERGDFETIIELSQDPELQEYWREQEEEKRKKELALNHASVMELYNYIAKHQKDADPALINILSGLLAESGNIAKSASGDIDMSKIAESLSKAMNNSAIQDETNKLPNMMEAVSQ